MNIEQIMQKTCPYIALELTFYTPCPTPDATDAPIFHGPKSPIPPTVEGLPVLAETMRTSLNMEQTEAYNAIIQTVLNNEGKTIFIYGPGDTGKSYVYKSATKRLQSLKLSYCAYASNGIRATLIDGCTVHLGFPMELEFDSCSMLYTNSKAAGIIKDASCIIWDEAPSSHCFMLVLVDHFLRNICRTQKPILSKNHNTGTRRGLEIDPPYCAKRHTCRTIAACLRMSSLWPAFSQNTFIFAQNMRATNPLFADWLLDIGNGISDPLINLLEHSIRAVHSPVL